MATALPNADILFEKRRRLDALQARQARLGWNTPPETANEIADIQRELAAIAPATVAESHDLIYSKLEYIQADVRRLYWLIPVLLLIVILAVKL
jgi:hypothetical protein